MRIRQIHIVLMLALIGAAATGCSSKDQPIAPGQQEIQLLAQSDEPQTRGSSALPTDYLLWVQGVYHNPYTDSYALLFSQEQEFVANSSGVWGHNGTPLYYPGAGAVDFISYALPNASYKPAATYAPAAFSSSSPTFSSLILDFGTKLDGTVPVVFSDTKTVTCDGQVPQQQLFFRHALSKIQFMMRAGNSGTASALTLYRLTLKGVQTSGKLQVTPAVTTSVTIDGNTVTTGSSAVWTQLYGAAKDIDIYNSANGMMPVFSTTAAELGNTVYLPTQASGTIDIEIEYSIRNPLGTTTQSLTKTVSLGAVNWLPTMQYTYTLIFSLDDITFECNETGATVDATPEDIDIDEEYKGTVPVNNN